MALQMATNITPDVFSGVGGAVFDAENGLDVSWQVNGTSPMVAYQIVIQSYDTESTELLTTGKVELSEPFYGTNYKGQVQFFEAESIDASALAQAGITNGNSYKMVITQWWGATDEMSVTQNSAAIIEAWNTPVVSMNPIPSPVANRKQTFTAVYAQQQTDPISWIRWEVATGEGNGTILYDSGNIYGTSELRLDYDGLFTGTSYAVMCTIQTQSGQTATTGWVTFSVVYPYSLPSFNFTAKGMCDTGSVLAQWYGSNISGNGSGEYAVRNNQLLLPQGTSRVEWNTVSNDQMQFAPPYTVVWKGKPKDFGGFVTCRYLDGDEFGLASLYGTEFEVEWQITGVDLTAFTIDQTQIDRWWTFVITPTKIYWQYLEEAGGLYPDTDLYPAQMLYPKASNDYTIKSGSVDWNPIQQTSAAVELSGPQTTEYVWVFEGEPTQTFIDALSTDAYFEPTWDDKTLFLADFKNGLNAGNFLANQYALYRRTLDTNEYKHLADFPIETGSVYDFGVKNQTEYEYQLHAATDSTFTASPMTSEIVKPCKWSWVLLGCTEDENEVYHVQEAYYFQYNVESGNVSNNNSPQMQKTFTRYPNYQPDTANYRSGTLKALIGSIDKTTNRYQDTTQQAEKLTALSTTSYTLFLKDRKGNLYMVRTGGAVQTAVKDEYPNQATTISIPWVEIDDAQDAVIIAAPGDGAYVEPETAQT